MQHLVRGVALEELVPGEHAERALELLPDPEAVEDLGRLAGVAVLRVERQTHGLQLVTVVAEGKGVSLRLSLAFLRRGLKGISDEMSNSIPV